MDIQQLRDFQRSIQFDQMNGIKPDKTTFLKLQRAIDRANELSAPNQQTAGQTTIDGIIKQQQDQRTATEQSMNAQNQAQLQSETQYEQQYLEQVRNMNAQAEAEQKKTLGYILGAQ